MCEKSVLVSGVGTRKMRLVLVADLILNFTPVYLLMSRHAARPQMTADMLAQSPPVVDACSSPSITTALPMPSGDTVQTSVPPLACMATGVAAVPEKSEMRGLAAVGCAHAPTLPVPAAPDAPPAPPLPAAPDAPPAPVVPAAPVVEVPAVPGVPVAVSPPPQPSTNRGPIARARCRIEMVLMVALPTWPTSTPAKGGP